MKPRRQKIAFRNKSPFGWWLASYLERLEFDDEDKTNANRRCLTWENTILLKASSRERAFEKAIATARRASVGETWGANGRRGQWRFEGVTELLPIYEQLEDGAEILWRERRIAVKTARSMVKTKSTLGVFDDTPAAGDSPSANNRVQTDRATRGR